MIELFEVGGCVRDALMGITSKDVDFVVIAPDYQAMKDHLIAGGFKIYIEKPEFLTIRASVPQNHILRERTKDADFVLARKDSETSDGRRPDSVEAGTLFDDLSRRDATINSIARDPITGKIFDPFNGRDDITNRVWRYVGDPMTRIREDGLRVLRALRFSVTKTLTIEPKSLAAITSEESAEMLQKVSIERIHDEIEKMFSHDTMRALMLISSLPIYLREAIFNRGLRLLPSLKQV